MPLEISGERSQAPLAAATLKAFSELDHQRRSLRDQLADRAQLLQHRASVVAHLPEHLARTGT